jgi:hypothetical protein
MRSSALTTGVLTLRERAGYILSIMSALFWIGSGLGAVCGLCHTVYLWRNAAERTDRRQVALYRGLWTVGLWTLFGTYLLVLWVLGAGVWLISKTISSRRQA